MLETTAMALVLGFGGFAVVVYFTTAVAAMLFGERPMSPTLRRLARMDRDQPNRLLRAIPLVLLLLAGEAVILAALLIRRDEFSLLGQGVLLLELIASVLWVAWLARLYRRRV